MGSFDGEETCELVACYILAQLQPKYGNALGLYCGDGLEIFKETPRKIECIKRDICKIFDQNNLRITIEATKKVVNFLDITQDLNTRQYMPYSKPNNTLGYVNVESNHPPAVTKNIPEGINKRLSEISSNEEIFERAAPEYQKALNDGGHPYRLHYEKPKLQAVIKEQESARSSGTTRRTTKM